MTSQNHSSTSPVLLQDKNTETNNTNPNTCIDYDQSYKFDPISELNTSTQSNITIELFRRDSNEQKASCALGKDLVFYCILKQAYQDKEKNNMVSMQVFCDLCDGTFTPPKTANLAYVSEKGDSKDTILHIVNELYNKYVRPHGKY